MCGIIGFVGKTNDVVPFLIEGLSKLEYRGYDSAGVAVYNSDGFQVVKRQGRLAVLEKALEENSLQGSLGLGHTRWATHGEPSDTNSHPHLSDGSRMAIVHNGIIENYKQLKDKLTKKGVTFTSETDSEVVAQLFEYYYNKSTDKDMLEIIIKVVNRLEGTFALGIMCIDFPETLFAVKKDNPLILGVAKDGNFLASDIPAILKYTNKIYYPEDGEIAVMTANEVVFYNQDKEIIEKELQTITWNLENAEKGGFPHFMAKEIHEQPEVIEKTLRSAISGDSKKIIDEININNYNKIVIVACGSAYNAGMCGKYVFETLCRLTVEVELASEFRYKNPLVDNKTLVVIVSQSGETYDTLMAMREAKKLGATVVGIVNVVGSAIAKEADYTLYTLAGPEIAVATTKAFSAQITLLYALAIDFAKKLGKIDDEKIYLDELAKIPELVKSLVTDQEEIKWYASTCFNSKSIFFIGRNIDYAISLEGSLKLKEISYIHSEAYAGGELKHGTISLIEENTLVVAVATNEALFPKIFSNVEQVVSRGAKVLLITNQDLSNITADDKVTADRKVQIIKIPEIIDLFSPSVSVIMLQMLAYYVADNKGLDIDKPRNLAKSVTVE